jgi:sialidase-1
MCFLILVGMLFPHAIQSDPCALPMKPTSDAHNFNYVCQDAGAGGYEAFPDVCRLKDGRLIVVFYAGYDHISLPNRKLPCGGRIYYCVSSDEGTTWGKPIVLLDEPYDDRDPSIAMLADGRLICSYFTLPKKGSYIVISDANALYWSKPQRIATLFNVTSPPRRLSTGRIVMGLYGENQANGQAAGASICSDDNAATWHTLAIMDNTGKYFDAETDVIELKDKTLYAIHRVKDAPMHFTTSIDYGSNWGRTKPLDFQGHCPYLHRTTDGIIVLGYRGMSETGQWQTYIRYSLDECRTWSEAKLVDDVSGAYPSMVNLKDNSVLIVYYEEGKQSDIRARKFKVNRFGVDWLNFDNPN